MKMKQWRKAAPRKKWVAICAAVLAAGMCLFAAAAGRWSGTVHESALASPGYTVCFEDDAFSLLWDGEEIRTYSLRSMNVKLSHEKRDGLCLYFVDADGQSRALTLGEQDTIAFDGKAESVTVEKGVRTEVVAAPGADLRDLRVGGATPVRVEGKVVYIELSGGAKVTVRPGGRVGTVNALSPHASLKVAEGGRVGKARGVSRSLAKDSPVPVSVTESVNETPSGGKDRPTVGSSAVIAKR